MIDFLKLPSPCYVLDETLLDRNLAVIDRVRRESGAEIIVALKACAMWSIFWSWTGKGPCVWAATWTAASCWPPP